ncbi:hypothetical protein BDW22DRAFT_1432521 [Trametopsis cervina]|nr:hypothetical protein BDW22DRAFT_1432521 [Trametopsis cervina]
MAYTLKHPTRPQWGGASDDDHATLEPALANEAAGTLGPSAHLVNPVDFPPPMSTMRDSEEAPAANDFTRDKGNNARKSTLHTTRSRTPQNIVDDSRSKAVIDEATHVADTTASPPVRDEEQGPFPRDPDTPQRGSSPCFQRLSSRTARPATSGVAFEDADSQAEPGADGGQTGLDGAMASTAELSSHGIQNDVDMSHKSASSQATITTDGHRATDTTSASTSDARDGVNTGGTG